MKVVKPTKLPVLHRTVEIARRLYFHVGCTIAFPLHAPRALLDELAFWQATTKVLGETGGFDEGFAKARGEVLVSGSFFAPGGKPVTASYARLQVGAIDKRVAVVGNRYWNNGAPTAPEPFVTMPLNWTTAFGGAGFDRNPYGKGVWGGGPRSGPAAPSVQTGTAPVQLSGSSVPVQPLPNVERYGQLLRSPSERPEPAGFLPMDVTFAQRRRRAGTYDARYLETFFPGFPSDMDPTFFNVAPEDQWLSATAQGGARPGAFRGDEAFLLENLHPEQAKIEGRLPGLVARCFVTQRSVKGDDFREISLACDTVWLFPSIGVGAVVFHGAIPVADDDAADIVHLVAACEDPAFPRSIEHYAQTLALRLDKDKGALAGLSDADLMPPKTSGVVPDFSPGDTDVGRWTKSEGFAMDRGRKGMERQFAEARARVLAEGLDPKDYGLDDLPPPPESPPVDDFDALAVYMDKHVLDLESQKKDMEAKAEQAKAEARRAFAEMGQDYDAEVKKAEKEGGGPPKFRAKDHLAKLSAMVGEAESEGVSLPDLEAQLASPEYWEQLKTQEAQLREMYRKFAHMQPAAQSMDIESRERIRTLVATALEADEPLSGRDFTGADLSNMELSGADFTGAFLEGVDFTGTQLKGTTFTNAVLTRARLCGADLTGAQLPGANLGGADLTNAVLDRADLSEAVLGKALLAGASFKGARLTGADWLDVVPERADFSKAILGEALFLKCDVSGSSFVGADLSGATWVECRLDGTDFTGAALPKATFVTCQGEKSLFRGASLANAVFVHGSAFPGADFTNADLRKANLRGTSLVRASFVGAVLDGADLSEADGTLAAFDGASLKQAMMIRARLDRASIRGANLMDALASKSRFPGADFTGSHLYRADVSRTIRDANTVFEGVSADHVRVLPRHQESPGGAA